MSVMARRGIVVALALLPAALVRAAAPRPAPAEVVAALPQARLQGQAVLRWFGLRVYDAYLWRGAEPVGADWAAAPLALEVEYARELGAQALVASSLDEMRRGDAVPTATVDAWRAQLQALLPDVRAGDRLTAVARPGQALRLYANGRLRGDAGAADDAAAAAFARRFIGIWLGPQTSQPALRRALLGEAAR